MTRPASLGPFLTAALFLSAMLLGATVALAQQEDGQTTFNNACRTCHTIKPGDNRLGPSLSGIVGAKSGAQQGFEYSAALKGGQITWDEATLDKFITNPDGVAPGNNMKPYTGIQDAGQRAKIISFLKSGVAAD